MPLTIAETSDFSVTLVSYFNDGMLQGFDFDITNKHPSHTLEIDVFYPAVNSYMPDGSVIEATPDAGETVTASMIFDRDVLDKDAFLSGSVNDLQLSVQVYDLSAGDYHYHPAIYDKVCRVSPNKVHPAADTILQYPYETNDVFVNDGRFTIAYLGADVGWGGTGEDALLIRDISLRFEICNKSGHALYFTFDDLTVAGETLPDYGKKYLYPGANGMTPVYYDVGPMHIYYGDLDALVFTLHVWDTVTQSYIYSDTYNVSIGAG